MGKTLIKIDCVDQRLFVSSGPIIASGGRNEDEIEFNFCPLWDGFEKVAVFYKEIADPYESPVNSDGRCVVPWEVLQSDGYVTIGVFGIKDGVVRTSATLKYKVELGAITENLKPSDPTPELWEQILGAMANKVDRFQGVENAGKILGIGGDGFVIPVSGGGGKNSAESGIEADAQGDNSISLRNCSDNPFKSFTLYGKTTQNGTPSPSAPQDFANACNGGIINVNIIGGNLIDYPYVAADGALITGITYHVNPDDRSVTCNGTASGASYFSLNRDTLYLEPGKYFCTGAPGEGYSGSTAPQLFIRNSDSTVVLYTFAEGAEFEVVNGAYFSAAIYIPTGCTVTNAVFKPMIFSVENEQTLTLAVTDGLPGIPVKAGGNYTDGNGQMWVTDEIDLARGVILKRVGKRIFNGSDVFYQSTANTFYIALNDAIANTVGALCDRYAFSQETTSNLTHGTFTTIKSSNNGEKRVAYFKDTEYSTPAAFAASQKEKPITILYASKQFEEIPLTDTELASYAALHTIKPDTVISNDSGIGMRIVYSADTKIYVDNKFEELRNAIISLGGNV